jgi:hypothetical protein
MASFGSINFGVRIDTPGGTDDTDVSEIHIPGGDVTYFDVGGRIGGHLTLTLRLADADYISLAAVVGSQDTLTYEGGTFADALLKSLKRTFRNAADGTTLADAEFITPSAPS